MTTDRRVYTYASRWNRTLAQPMDPISEDEALERWKRGDLFTAMVADDDGVWGLVQANPSARRFEVAFLNESGEDLTVCKFGPSSDRLFIEAVHEFSYPAGYRPGMPREIRKMDVEEDGHAHFTFVDLDSLRTTFERDDINTHDMYADYPEFGDWAELLRADRDIAPTGGLGDQQRPHTRMSVAAKRGPRRPMPKKAFVMDPSHKNDVHLARTDILSAIKPVWTSAEIRRSEGVKEHPSKGE